jgi:surface antigen
VLAWGGRKSCRQSLYNRTVALRLFCRHCPVPTRAFAILLCALAVSGCSYKLASLASADDSEPQSTGTIGMRAVSSVAPATPLPQAELDLAYARAAVADVLSRGSKDTSVPWQNPRSGARGNITPLASSYSEAGMACRDFLASYIHGEWHEWLEGAACRTGGGSWQGKRLKPLKSN